MIVFVICIICIGAMSIRAEAPDLNLGRKERPDSLTAIFDMAGVQGVVHFLPTLEDNASDDVVIWVKLTAPGREGESLRWHIAENPLDTGSSEDPCNPKTLGRSIVDLSGRYGDIVIGQEVTLPASGKVIRADRIFERTLVIRGTRSTLRACASISSSVKVSTYEARFRSVVAGTLVLRQVMGQPVTGVRSELYWTRGNRRLRTPELRWALMVAPVGSSDDCSDLKSKVQHSARTSSNMLMMARNKLPAGGSVTLTRTRAKKYVIENRWPSLEDYEGLWVILYSWDVHVRGAAVVACAPVHPVLAASASAAFPAAGVPSDAGVTGVIHMTQMSPYGDPTTVTVDLALPGNAVGFGIDDLPTSPSSLTGSHCLHKLSLTYFNPLNADTDVAPPPLEATSDRYPVGDLGGRFLGPLSNLTRLRTTYNDHYLMLSGTKSALGRMLVIYDKHWYPLSCAPLYFEYDPKTVIAEAAFDGPVKGQVRFTRRTSDPLADTAIRVDLRHTETGNASANHIWSIHDRWSSDEDVSVDECFDPGNTYNPLKVESSGMYDCECHQDTAMRCKSGDLQGKLGPIKLGGAIVEEDHLADVSHVQLLFDQSSFLDGNLSIVGKLLVVRAPDFAEDIMACAVIRIVY